MEGSAGRWAEFIADRDDVTTLRRWANSRQWKRIAKKTGLPYDDARDLGAWLRGKPISTKGQRPRAEHVSPGDAPRNVSPETEHEKRTTDVRSSSEPSAGDGSRVSVSATTDGAVATARGETIRTLPQLLAAAEIDLQQWIVESWTANVWQANAGAGQTIDLWQVKAHLKRRPDWVVSPLRPVAHVRRKRERGQGTRQAALIVPDSQNGYRWNVKHDALDPLHDRCCWDLAVQLAQRLQPSEIILLGDMLDLAPWSLKYADGADLRGTTQPTLAELHWWLGQLRMAAPGARIVYLEGNHEDRIGKALRHLLAEAEGVRPVDDEDGAPMMSVPRLLALDSLDVEYVGPYDSEHWLWGAVRVHHGERVRAKGGATATAVVGESTHCDVFGHVHRLELACRTQHGPDGERTIWAMSPGTITRVDGVVPAAASRVDWQQGLAVVERDDSGGLYPVLLPIESGRLWWCREVLVGRDRAEDISAATGWAF